VVGRRGFGRKCSRQRTARALQRTGVSGARSEQSIPQANLLAGPCVPRARWRSAPTSVANTRPLTAVCRDVWGSVRDGRDVRARQWQTVADRADSGRQRQTAADSGRQRQTATDHGCSRTATETATATATETETETADRDTSAFPGRVQVLNCKYKAMSSAALAHATQHQQSRQARRAATQHTGAPSSAGQAARRSRDEMARTPMRQSAGTVGRLIAHTGRYCESSSCLVWPP